MPGDTRWMDRVTLETPASPLVAKSQTRPHHSQSYHHHHHHLSLISGRPS
jgi:hypothetical protein